MAKLFTQYRHLLIAVLTLLFVSACGSDNNGFRATTTFEVALTGAQQVPFNNSTQTATAFIQINENSNQIAALMDVSGIEGFQVAHLHQGGIGVNGPVNFPLTMDGDMVILEPSEISQADLDSLLSGEWYVNLHTTEFPDGEIRGQIVPNSVVIVSFGLSGEQEVPSVATLASGQAYASYDVATTDLNVRVNTQGAEDATMAHIHTGRIGANGPVLVGLEASADAGAWENPADLTLDADTFAVLASGGHYINVHTPANPAGEIRGQILTPNFVLATFPLQGSQEVPAVNTSASGDAYALINTDDLSVELTAVTQGVEDATMAHIHTGRIGTNGPVLVGLVQSAEDVNTWMSPDDLVINADIFAVLASGGHYVNVHTPANPGGELRGQIVTDNFILATFPLQGEQEVPSVTTVASGEAYALVNITDFSIELQVLTRGVMDATMAHIHTGRIGTNGPVLAGLVQSEEDPNRWTSPADLTVDADTLAVLASGGHYVNVHTPANPGGELRGQIVTDNFVLTAFDLSGVQEVPAVSTAATGSGYALVDTLGFGLELRVVTSGVEDASMAHIHTGRIGTNGPVLVGLVQSGEDVNTWMSPDDLVIDADIFAVLASGGHYVNVHTPANPGGELRGQIVTDNFILATFPLQGEQEVPSVSTAASGEAYALVNTTDLSIELQVLTRGVMDATMAHIHTGRIGTNGPVLVGLVQSEEDPNRWTSPADLTVDADTLAVLASGGHYINVHTPANPSGELRGQILTDNFVLATFDLSGAQEVPAVSTTATGSGYALVDSLSFGLELRVVTSGVEDATMAHIHTGRIGTNGPVLVGLEQSEDNAGMWSTPADLSIDADIFAVLASGGHYINVHTPANPSGELRGQILTDNFVLIAFPLSGDQQVPPVTTDASGSAYALVNTSNFAVELVAVTQGVEDATMAHIHTGPAGENGPVLVGLEQSEADLNVWKSPAELMIDATIFNVLASGGHYVNVHTPANPDGELRGQIQ